MVVGGVLGVIAIANEGGDFVHSLVGAVAGKVVASGGICAIGVIGSSLSTVVWLGSIVGVVSSLSAVGSVGTVGSRGWDDG